MEIPWDAIVAVGILLILLLIIIAEIRNQTLRESLNEIKELITGG